MDGGAPHAQPIEQLIERLETHLALGLSAAQAQQRLAQHGPNELSEQPRPGLAALLGRQFDNALVLVLLVAALVSFAIGEWTDALAIAIIVALNAAIGAIQEFKAEESLAALKKMAAPQARAVRDGRWTAVAGRELVPGDVVLLEAGGFVPADLRLFQAAGLKVDEAALTGESVAVDKDAALVLAPDAPLGDRRNTAFMGTVVAAGRGTGVVTATGMQTQIGLIAQMIQAFEDEATPLQRQLARVGRILGLACIAICALVFAIGLLRDTQVADAVALGVPAWLATQRPAIVELFMTAVSLAIAAVPEGLPAIVTVCLALGMQRMIRHHALIRRLPAVETLGCASVICSDKTGTLTQNRMTVVQLWVAGRTIEMLADEPGARPRLSAHGKTVQRGRDPDLAALLEGAVACNDARIDEWRSAGNGFHWNAIGDPTESAMLVAAAAAGCHQSRVAEQLPRTAELAFDARRKRMTTVHRVADHGALGSALARAAAAPWVAIVKGAPDVMLERSTRMLDDGNAVELTHAMRAAIAEQIQSFATRGLRVLAVALRPLHALPAAPSAGELETELVFVGLLGMTDPPRAEVPAALARARAAGVKTVMVTGDYKETAAAIARSIGLSIPGGLVLTGAEIERMSDAELAARADRVDVCCRVSPQDKTRIVDAFRARGHVVAMTGDGVNDAPALKRADIGIAMGVVGTDVARQTADMVLTDDNFASIVAAIEQGRIIYSNIRKFVYFLLACNVGEVLIVFGALLAGLPMPLVPVQLLWLNLVTDGAPALALGIEQGDDDVMQQPPRRPDTPVIDRSMMIGIALVALVDLLAVLTVFWLALQRHPGDLPAAQTVAFVTLALSELLRAFAARSELRSVFAIGLLSNRWMIGATALSLVLVLAVVYLPALAPFFGTVPLGINDWLTMLPFLFASPLAMELYKARLRGTRSDWKPA